MHESLSRICERETVLKALLKFTKTDLCTFESPSGDFAIVCARRPMKPLYLAAIPKSEGFRWPRDEVKI